MAKKQSENYLDFVPLHNPANEWEVRDGIVTIHVVYKGFYHTIAQKFFGTPRVSHIDLEQYGSFLWQQMDGKKTVGQLAEAMKAQFGREADPLYLRLVKYVHTLHNNRFILFAGKDKVRV